MTGEASPHSNLKPLNLSFIILSHVKQRALPKFSAEGFYFRYRDKRCCLRKSNLVSLFMNFRCRNKISMQIKSIVHSYLSSCCEKGEPMSRRADMCLIFAFVCRRNCLPFAFKRHFMQS